MKPIVVTAPPPSDVCTCGEERFWHYGLRGACLSSKCKHECKQFQNVTQTSEVN